MSPVRSTSSGSCFSGCKPPDPNPPKCKKCKCKCEKGASKRPIRYGNGEIQMSVRDLISAGFGQPWGHTRYYTNRLAESDDFGNGYNWVVEQWPYVTDQGDSLAVVWTPQHAVWFDKVSGSFIARYGAQHTLVKVSNVYKLTFPEGEVWEFHSPDQTTYPIHSFKQVTSPGGIVTKVSSYTASDRIAETIRTEGSVSESYLYTYGSSGADADRLQEVLLRRGSTSSWTNIQRAVYTYHDGTDAHGSAGDLKTASQQVWDGSSWVETAKYYYRYYKNSAGGIGFQHGLKYVVEPNAYKGMTAASLDPLTASDAQLAGYADYYFEYSDETDRRVTKERVAGGTAEYGFSYTTSGFTDDYNNWKRKTVETRPDGSQNIVFTNHLGQVMLQELNDGNSPAKRWIDFYQYDNEGREVLHAQPSAINMSASMVYAQSSAGLNVQLRSSDGLIHLKTYYGSSDPITSGGTGTGTGAAQGYQEYEQITRGSSGTPIKLRRLQYTSNTAGGVTIYPVAKDTVYRNEDGTGAIVTSYEYTWPTGSNQHEQLVTKLPVVSAEQNGSGLVDSRTERFDTFGNLIWERGPRGFIRRHVYDSVRGVLTQSVEDVNTTLVSDEPSGWVTPSGGGLHVVTDYEYDDQNRATQVLGPSHEADVNGTATTVRTASWTVYKDDLREVWTAQGYQAGSSYTLVNPVSIARSDAQGHLTDSISAVRSSTSGKLSASDSFPQSSWVRWSATSYNIDGQTTATRVYHTTPSSGQGVSGTNYDETVHDYDLMERPNMVKSPGGTITRTVFDVRDLPVSTYVGTNDAGATNSDPTGGGATGNNMVLVSASEYDSGVHGGDGNLTKRTLPVDSNTANDRVTLYSYDWRNRLTSIDGEIDFYEERVYDNLGHVTRVDQRNTTSSGNLVARSETLFDDRGRLYRSIRYAVDPATGTVGNSLVDNRWYDAAKNLIKQRPAGSETFTKSVYDGLGRKTKLYIGYDTAESSYADAGTLTSDTIFEQEETTYDSAGNVLNAVHQKRFHDATGTGALNGPTGSQPKSRPSYVASWYDGVGRQVASADFGTNDNAAFARPSTVPTRSDTILVTSIEYNSGGDVFKTIDAAGRESRVEFDHAGRRTKFIENYVDGDPSTGTADQDRTTLWSYNADGQVKSLTAKNTGTGDQVTMYVYGTTTADSDIARNDLLRAAIYPDSDDVDSPLGNGSDGVYDRVEYRYNRQGEPNEMKDQIGTVHSYDYDKLGRRTQDRVTTLGAGVDGAVRRIGHTYEVRGLVEKVTSYDNAVVGSGSVVNEVQMAYNGFDQLASEYQAHSGAVNTSTSPKVQYGYANGSANTIRPTSITYPSGRVIDYGYSSGADSNLSRISYIGDGTTHLADYTYLGLDAFVRVDYTEPDVRYDLITGSGSNPYAGLDRFGRVIDCLWHRYSGTPADLERIKYGYDRVGSRTYRENIVADAHGGGFDELYDYDGLNQLKSFKRGDLNTNKDAIAGLEFAQEWGLDATGNWSTFKEDNDGNGAWNLNQIRVHNKGNEITAISEDSGQAQWIDPVHNPVGNTTTLPKPATPTSSYSATYDSWMRLVKLMDGLATVAEYVYDSVNRRIRTIASGDVRDFYHNSDAQLLEEHVDSALDGVYDQVWGLAYVDELVLRDWRAANGSNVVRHYSIQDSLFSVVALIDSSGAVLERYVYQAYGACNVLSTAFVTKTSTDFDWTTRFTGRELDLEPGGAELGLYYYRTRFYHQGLGRFLTRDSDEYRSEDLNLFRYSAGSPVNFVDPDGKQGKMPAKPRQDKECCEEALKMKFNFIGDRRIGGTVVCCDGRKVSCVWIDTKSGNLKADTRIRRCLLEHEDHHHDDVKRCPGCLDCLERAVWKKPENEAIEECAAYRVERKCLRQAIHFCGRVPSCMDALNQRLKEITEYGRRRYGCIF